MGSTSGNPNGEGSVEKEYVERERLFGYDKQDRVVGWREYLSEREKNKKNQIIFSSGFAELDHYLDSFQTGELIVISGITGNGKTLFAKTLVRNFVSQGIPSLVFSFEVSTQEFLRAYTSYPNIEKMYVPLEMKPGALNWLANRILEAKVKYDNKVVVIDHLHYIVDMNTDKNFSINVGAAMRQLKEFAIRYNQLIFIISHQQMIKKEDEPGIESIRDSSFIGQEADSVLIVHRVPDETHEAVEGNAGRTKHVPIDKSKYTYEAGFAMVKIEKARRAGTYKKKLSFIKKEDWLEPV